MCTNEGITNDEAPGALEAAATEEEEEALAVDEDEDEEDEEALRVSSLHLATSEGTADADGGEDNEGIEEEF